MGRCKAGLALLAVWLAGCVSAPPPPPEIGYLAPDASPPTARSALVQQPPFLLFGNVVDLLQQGAFKVTRVDEQAGYVVAEYSGDPEPYVTCGWIVSYQTGALERVPAAIATSRLEKKYGKDRITLDRNLRLDGRMVVRLEPEGSGTVVRTDATYVLTKTIAASHRTGRQLGRDRETISFSTGETGEFSKGTVCQPTGRLEHAVLDSLPAVSVADGAGAGGVAPGRAAPGPTSPGLAPQGASVAERVSALTARFSCANVRAVPGPGDSLRLVGFVGSESDLARLQETLARTPGIGPVENQVEVDSWPFCEVLEVLAPYEEANRRQAPPLAITTTDGSGILRQGQDLTLDLNLPRTARYLYLGYLQHDGRVGYIATMSVREWAESSGRIRFRTGYEIAPPFGRELLVAVASVQPLFDQPRAAYEPAAGYLQALRARLEAIGASDPSQMVFADHLFITTEPSRGF